MDSIERNPGELRWRPERASCSIARTARAFNFEVTASTASGLLFQSLVIDAREIPPELTLYRASLQPNPQSATVRASATSPRADALFVRSIGRCWLSILIFPTAADSREELANGLVKDTGVAQSHLPCGDS